MCLPDITVLVDWASNTKLLTYILFYVFIHFSVRLVQHTRYFTAVRLVQHTRYFTTVWLLQHTRYFTAVWLVQHTRYFTAVRLVQHAPYSHCCHVASIHSFCIAPYVWLGIIRHRTVQYFYYESPEL